VKLRVQNFVANVPWPPSVLIQEILRDDSNLHWQGDRALPVYAA